ncbi:MAG: hypothetical protein AAB709_00150 [Patescibacteria group bacterium]
MKRFIVLEKKVGETPLMAIQAWKKACPAYADVLASYAGRLDPMASGKLLILLGEECKRQRAYTDLDKAYEIEVLLDVGSDTGDALGVPAYAHKKTILEKKKLAAVLRRERGAYARAYPAFSSKTVSGKPLFLHALEGTLPFSEIPEHIERIYRIQSIDSYSIPSSELEASINAFLDCVPRTHEPSKRLGADFRVDAIRAHWESLFKEMPERNFTVLRLNVVCASGTYMRSLAGRIGTALGTRALALSIKRTKIGNYIPLGTTGFWLRTY